MSDGDVIKYKVESKCTTGQIFSDKTRYLRGNMGEQQYCRKVGHVYHFTLGNQLAGIKLCDDTLEHFIDNGGQDALVVIFSKFAVDGRECLG